jgi:hypothetical protein
MMLVYSLRATEAIYQRFGGIDGGVPVRVDDPFERGSVVDVTVIRGDARSTTTIMFG